ncbi:MAG: DUF4011 domain-containing protein [Alphaproteobacteria bacterium]|nr:DUF4011 domain-containing protein [Alphaproteobacteria bacterium]
MSTTLSRALEEARRGLLDLSTRNRLLSLPALGRSRGVVTLDDEDADFVWARLAEGKGFGFEASGAAATEKPKGRAPKRAGKADGVEQAGSATRDEWQRDEMLRVALAPAELTRRLRDIMADTRSAREETGVPSLFIALGALAWRDAGTPGTERLAPLVLVPASIEREGVSARFRLRANAEEVAENLSLREKLVSMGIALPAFDADTYDPTQWAETVAAVAQRPDWRVDADAIAVGLFSFAKFLMWRDLSPDVNPGLADHPLVRSLVGGEALPPQPPAFADDADVDAEIPVERLDHVADVDGSQALATELVRRGGHVVIQGPPGTGKSQSICNILAQAVLDGRSVLFVAEKLAALEVVKRRLEGLGLGAACLELHSEKQSKRAVLDELRATLALPAPPRAERDAVVKRLGEMRGRLNRHAGAMRGAVGRSDMPLHRVIGGLVALRRRGVAAPDFTVPAPDAAQLVALRDAARELAARAAGAASPWRGVTVALDATQAERVLARLPGLIRAIAGAPDITPTAARPTLARAQTLARRLGESLADDAGWQGGAARIAALRTDLALLASPDGRLKPAAARVQGLDEARATLGEAGGMFGFLSAARRAAKAVLAEVARDADADPLPVLDAAIARRDAAARLEAAEHWAHTAFGESWRTGVVEAPAQPAAPLTAACAAVDELQALLGMDAGAIPFPAIAEWLAAAASEPDALQPWLAWHRARGAASELAPLADALAAGRIAPEAAQDAAEYAMLEALLRAATRADPALAAFDGEGFDRVVEEFRAADAARVALTRAEAATAHHSRMRAVRDTPGLRMLAAEMEKRRGHLPVRELLLRAGSTVQAIKPVFMMSPLSVAQFLAPPHGLKPGLSFDLLVMDEASQIEPVDALGAIARCRQMVVVGDDKQMPPTRFFQRMTTDEEEVEAPSEELAAREVESILGLANARGVPNAMLRWHYRSRHESLIATSNAEFYGGRLFVLPSPRPRSAALGLSLVKVDGELVEGVNSIEAEAVAAAVIQHAKNFPRDSLGVATFSMKQRDAIVDALELLRTKNPEADAFFSSLPNEPFFVKNLENVQGDERDSIFISIGYARKGAEHLRMNFGPVSAEGGERRLNVLISRAKKRCLVFSDITADDIDLSRSDGVGGEKALKSFLAFAAGGVDAPRGGAGGGESPLASAISDVVQGAGKRAVQRIGISGLYLDVAAAGDAGFELGIEADGADWSALRCARDRDRGRQGALTQMGWRLTRSWSLDWLNRPKAAEARLRAALGAPVEEAAAAIAPDPGLATPYVEALLEVPKDSRMAAIPPGARAALVAQIITAEAPVHTDAVAERMRILWGAAALDAADRTAIAEALRFAAQLHGTREQGGFHSAEDSPPPVPRNRAQVGAHLRRPAMIAPAEIEAAAVALQAATPALTEKELATGITRMLGLEASATSALAVRVAALVGAGRVKLSAP